MSPSDSSLSREQHPSRSRFGHALEWLVTKHPTRIMVAFAIAAVLLAVGASRIQLGPGLDELLLDDDPDLVRNDEIKLDFSNDEIVLIAYDLGREIDADALAMLARIRRELEQLDGVDEVIDLTNIEDVRGHPDDPERLDASPLVDDNDLEIWRNPRALGELRARLAGHRLYDGGLVSADLRVVATIVIPALAQSSRVQSSLVQPSNDDGVSVPVSKTVTQAELNAELVSDIYDVVRELPVPTWVAGYPAAEIEAQTIVLRDLTVLTTVAVVVLVVIAWIFLRSFPAIVVLLIVVTWTELAAIAWLAVTGRALNVVLSTLPTILLAVSSTYAIYLMSLLPRRSTERDVAATGSGPALLRATARSCWLSALSTAAGFWSLRLMPVPAISDLGQSLAIGIAACLLTCLLLVPAIAQRFDLTLGPLPFRRISSFGARGVALSTSVRGRLAVLAVTIIVAMTSATGLVQLRLESDPVTFWKKSHYHRLSDSFIGEHLGGSLLLSAVISTDEPDGALEPEVLTFARLWIEHAESSSTVSRTHSLLDTLALIDDVIDPDRARRYFDDRARALEYLLLYESSGDPDDLRHYVDFDRGALNVFLRTNNRSSREILELRDSMLAFAETRPQGTRAEVLGTWLLFPKAMDGIARGMVRGLIGAGLVIFVVLLVFLRSLRLALVAMVPNTLPILVCLGTLGWLDIPLSFATSIVGCVALGLAVDDTAHVIGHLRRGASLDAVYARVGRALIVTTLSLGSGFLVLGLSGFLPLVHFGIATAVSLVVAVLADLLLLPTLLTMTGLVRGGRVVGLGDPATSPQSSLAGRRWSDPQPPL